MTTPAAPAALAPQTRFSLPVGSEATAPPERRGVSRDGVRLLVARPGGIGHRRFHELPDLLEPGDLVVVNTSATVPAALDASADGMPAVVHVSAPLDDGSWVVEVRRTDGSGSQPGVRRGSRLDLPGNVGLQLLDAYPDPMAVGSSRLWRSRVTPPVALAGYLARYGRPVSYGYLSGRFPLADYQTVYATEPGSAEMASAGRPFTTALLARLMARGVPVAPVVLHSGVSTPSCTSRRARSASQCPR